MKKIKIIFICLGNICRSPLAEGVMRQKILDKGLTQEIEVDSAGTGSWHIGENPDHRSIQTAKKHGIDISQHKGQQMNSAFFQKYDYFIVMDQQNLRNVQQMAHGNLSESEFAQRILMLRHFDPKSNNTNAAVPDPYYGTLEDFEKVFKILDRSMEKLLDFIISNEF